MFQKTSQFCPSPVSTARTQALDACLFVQVHRLLLAAVGTGDADKLMGNKDLQTLAEHINVKHRVSVYM